MLVLMGSGAETARETVSYLQARGERVGVAQIRLYRPFPAQELVAALPATARRVAVLDRTKEPGSLGEPLFLDVLAALSEAHADGEREPMPKVIGGRYGLSSKEFTPGCRRRARRARRRAPKRRFTVGITDDVSHTSLRTTTRSTSSRPTPCARCSSASAPTARSARTRTRSRSSAPRRACTPRATSSTTRRSRARRRSRTCASGRSPSGRRTSSRASFVGCHQFGQLPRKEVLDRRRRERRCCSTAATRRTVWDALPREVQERMLEKRIELYVIDAGRIARDAGLAGARTRSSRRASSRSRACSSASRRSSGSRRRSRRPTAAGAPRSWRATRPRSTRGRGAAQGGAARARVTAAHDSPPVVPEHAPEFVRTVTAR